MGTLLKSLREYKAPSILCPIVMVGEAAMEIIIPYLMTFIIGELRLLSADPAYQVNTQNIIIYSVLMVVCAGFALFCGVWGGKLSAKASCGFAHNLREDMYNNIQTYSFANIDNYSTASLITRVTTDVTNVQNAYQMTIRMLVRAPVLFVSSIIMTCLIEPTMALIFVGGAIILGLIVFFCMFKVIPYFKKMFEKYDGLNSVVQENLTAIRVVKSYVREETEIDKMQRATAEVYKYSVKAEKIFTILMPCVSLVMYATIIIIFTVGSNMAVGNVAGNVQPEQLQTLNIYAMQILSGVMMVAMCINFISMSRGSMERIREVLNEKSTLPKAENPVTEVADGSIEFENVDFAYSQKSDVCVLSGINLKINSGETVGVIGATGSGKTS
ncbi:MAG: ABC transporter ATP-binding protein, partial [Clostridia bacterium]|nr:ABC transporter ATP-binding protein [Clostridia bacterium]